MPKITASSKTMQAGTKTSTGHRSVSAMIR